MGERHVKADAIDEIQKQWKSVCPELNSWPMAIIGRISRLERGIDERMRAACAEFGVERWGFDVLATLRRAGSPFVLTPTQLYRSLLLTSGAMTNRLDRLEDAGLVKRTKDPNDRRGLRIVLTSKGRDLVDRVVVVHMEVEAEMLAAIPMKQQRDLANLLRLLSDSIERSNDLPSIGEHHE
jgi:DNA-binding MarR family transcriptional regulator